MIDFKYSIIGFSSTFHKPYRPQFERDSLIITGLYYTRPTNIASAMI